MIVEFPDGIMKYSEKCSDSYGIKTFMLTRAVGIDYFVLVSLFEIIKSESYILISKMIEKRFDLSLDACLLHRIKIERESSEERRTLQFTKNRVEESDEQFESLKKSVNSIIIDEYDKKDIYHINHNSAQNLVKNKLALTKMEGAIENEGYLDNLSLSDNEDDIFHHNSDLYVFVSELTTNVIKEWCKINGYKFDEIRKDSFLLSTFNDQITGKQMYDIAFQYYER